MPASLKIASNSQNLSPPPLLLLLKDRFDRRDPLLALRAVDARAVDRRVLTAVAVLRVEAPVRRLAVADRRLEDASSSSAWDPASSPAFDAALDERLDEAFTDPDLLEAAREAEDLEAALLPDFTEAASAADPLRTDLLTRLRGAEAASSSPARVEAARLDRREDRTDLGASLRDLYDRHGSQGS